jgi:hypothetical protein
VWIDALLLAGSGRRLAMNDLLLNWFFDVVEMKLNTLSSAAHK